MGPFSQALPSSLKAMLEPQRLRAGDDLRAQSDLAESADEHVGGQGQPQGCDAPCATYLSADSNNAD